MFTALAVNALNTALGSVDQPGGIFFTPGGAAGDGVAAGGASSAPTGARAGAERARPMAALDGSKILLIDEANPVYSSPPAWKVRDAIEKIPFIVSFASFVDDTSAYADLILPDHTFLESWVQSTPESGSLEAVSTVAEPVMKPIHDTRATADVLIEVAGKLKTPIALPWKDAEELMKSSGASRQPSAGSRRSPVGSRQSPGSLRYDEPRFDGDPAQYPFHFLPYVSPAFGDGSSAHLPWLQEMPDPLISHRRRGRCASRRSSSRASRPTSSRCRSDRGTSTSPATPAAGARTRCV
jgi:anaerobic selenocysteine-containing dehydrogenase